MTSVDFRKTVAIIQARMGSSRLPGKMMKIIAGAPVIEHVVRRVGNARLIDETWLACPESAENDELASFAKNLGISVYRGDEEDVLSRFVAVAHKSSADAIVRITGDCPMSDGSVIDAAVKKYYETGADYLSNGIERTFPDGLDVEVFSKEALFKTAKEAIHPFLKAHVTPYIHGRLRDTLPCGNFDVVQLVNSADFSHLRWTLDEPEDLEFLQKIIPQLPENYGWMDAVALVTRTPELLAINNKFSINEGTERDLEKFAVADVKAESSRPVEFSQSDNLFERASKVIPLASQTFSKSHQQWVRHASPLFIESGDGAIVTDPDGNSYVDYVLALMPVILGYCDPDVDDAIRRQLEKGIIFPLSSPLETELAEKLCHIIPCAEQVRFGKNGSDVTAAAVRLARAHTGRDRIVACGYHGWHDWYIGTTTRNLGVPESTIALTTSVPFNDFDALNEMFQRNGDGDRIAAVIMEPTSKSPAEPGYLEAVAALTQKYGALLIFDEIITGFRVGMGGAQAATGVTPDLATFGKSMANGMPISALAGRREYMGLCEDIFFSGTFGGETLSLAAAIATIDKLERLHVPARLNSQGAYLMDAANKIADSHGVSELIQFSGESWWPRLEWLDAPMPQDVMTSLLRQNMVGNGLLLASSFNLCLAHTDAAITERTLASLDSAMAGFAADLNAPDPRQRVRGALVQPTFAVRP